MGASDAMVRTFKAFSDYTTSRELYIENDEVLVSIDPSNYMALESFPL